MKQVKLRLGAPRKRFGQNFLEDPLVIASLLQAIQLRSADKVIEMLLESDEEITEALLKRLASRSPTAIASLFLRREWKKAPARSP